MLPGLPTIRRVPLLGLLLFVVGVAMPIVLGAWVFANRDDLVGMALDPQFLTTSPQSGARSCSPACSPSPKSPMRFDGVVASGAARRWRHSWSRPVGAGAVARLPRQRGANGGGERVRQRWAVAVRPRPLGRSRGDHQCAPARRRCRSGAVGAADRHDDRRQHSRGHRSHGVDLDPAQPDNACSSRPAVRSPPSTPTGSTISPTPCSPTSPTALS